MACWLRIDPFPLVGIPIGVHSGPHSARLAYPSHLKIDTLAGALPAFNCSDEVFAMDILGEQTYIPPGPYGPALRIG